MGGGGGDLPKQEVSGVMCIQGSSLLVKDCGRQSDERLAGRCSLWGWLSLRSRGRQGSRDVVGGPGADGREEYG